MRVAEIEAHPGYRLREDGVLQSDLSRGAGPRKRTGIWRDLKPSINKRWGYAYVDLRTGSRRNARLNVLMMETFIGPCPPGQEVRHKDGNRLNNRLDNLCYGTRSQNMQDAVVHGTIKRGIQQEFSKLDDEKVADIRRRIAAGETQARLVKEYGVSSSVISQVFTGKAWKHV